MTSQLIFISWSIIHSEPFEKRTVLPMPPMPPPQFLHPIISTKKVFASCFIVGPMKKFFPKEGWPHESLRVIYHRFFSCMKRGYQSYIPIHPTDKTQDSNLCTTPPLCIGMLLVNSTNVTCHAFTFCFLFCLKFGVFIGFCRPLLSSSLLLSTRRSIWCKWSSVMIRLLSWAFCNLCQWLNLLLFTFSSYTSND